MLTVPARVHAQEYLQNKSKKKKIKTKTKSKQTYHLPAVRFQNPIRLIFRCVILSCASN